MIIQIERFPQFPFLFLISKNLNDVESIFIVTHHSDISIPADKEIKIIKGKDKVSRIDL